MSQGTDLIVAYQQARAEWRKAEERFMAAVRPEDVAKRYSALADAEAAMVGLKVNLLADGK